MVVRLAYRRSSLFAASWLSFGTARRRDKPVIPAMFSKALIRPYLVYPLASLDVSGQWRISHTAASPNEVSICFPNILRKANFVNT